VTANVGRQFIAGGPLIRYIHSCRLEDPLLLINGSNWSFTTKCDQDI